ncbi:nuclear transport factor 2 family protein [Actinoplanes sp. NPDC051470]|uniref:nuclear transport factor 2 family protein n=1 Tax=Actinoplanes sp. NPDC051470 TaxID=3157224 RepID=UPI003427EBC5
MDIQPPDQAAVDVAVAAFRGLQRGALTGDWTGFVDLLTDDVRIMIPVPATEEEAPEGVLRGKDIARMLFASHHDEKVQGARLECKRVAANGPPIVMEARVEGNLNGELVANHFVFAFEVADGLITSMYEYATWTAKGSKSRWTDLAFARDTFPRTLIPAP